MLYSRFEKTLCQEKSHDLTCGSSSVVHPVTKRRKSKTWWEDGIKWRHRGSESFLRDVWRGVFKSEKKKIRPKVIDKELSGATIGRSHMSLHVVEGIARREANLAVGRFDQELFIESEYGDLYLSASDDELKNWCSAKAEKCSRFLHLSPMPGWEIRELLRSYGLELPIYDLFGLQGAMMRTVDERWWRRQVRKMKARRIDEMARSLRMVHASGQVYCSDELHRIKRRQRSRNRQLLESIEAKNGDGDIYTLAELSDLSVSNPQLRRNELMTRMRGFENLADGFEHQGVFITLTAPSAFHPMRQIKANKKLVRVVANPKWNGATVREAQDWMNKSWKLVRAEWARKKIQCYGFRVVESHHDGCPHWHALLFFENDRDVLAAAIKTLRKKMFREYAEEKGAKQHRVRIVMIDKTRGSATGYIAKYIAKNIDGSHLEDDLFGNDAKMAAEKICDWASGHGIRQFQQIGGPSVSVWRELRRMDEDEGFVGEIRRVADSADWEAYCLMQGGPFIRARSQPVRLARWIETSIDIETGECIDLDKTENSYGEETVGRVFGLVAFGRCFLSRVHRWVIGGSASDWQKEFRKTVERKARELSSVALYPGSFAELLSVNRIVVPGLMGDDLADFLRGDGLLSN